MLVVSFCAGIVTHEIFREYLPLIISISAILLLTAAICLFLGRKSAAILLLVIALATSAGFLRGYVALVLNNRKTPIDQYVDTKISMVGVIGEEQEKRDFNTRLNVIVQEIQSGTTAKTQEKITQTQKVSGIKVLVTTDNPKDFTYGDVVRVTGTVSLPENFYTETGREFDYVGYLRTNHIKFLIKNASVTVLGHDPPSRILSGLFFAKRAFVGSIRNMLPEPESSLAAGILIDGKQSINGELQEKFQKTGIVHIVVLSGSNVSIVAEALSRVFAFLPRFFGLFSASLGIIAFTMVTGATATVVRASIMAIIVIISRLFMRSYDPARGLFIATFLMLIQNPGILSHSPSFQLSFLATFAVIKIVPKCEKWVSNVCDSSGSAHNLTKYLKYLLPEKFGIRELVISNITVQLFLFPILSWMTGFVSAVSLPTNILVVPLVSVTMLLSFLTAVAGLVWRFLAMPFAFVAHLLLSYELAVVDFFSKFSLASIPFSGFSTVIVAGFYVLTIIIFIWSNLTKKT